jgi:hypothetical protein
MNKRTPHIPFFCTFAPCCRWGCLFVGAAAHAWRKAQAQQLKKSFLPKA